jgi:Cu2+-containing amine oxidase
MHPLDPLSSADFRLTVQLLRKHVDGNGRVQVRRNTCGLR